MKPQMLEENVGRKTVKIFFNEFLDMSVRNHVCCCCVTSGKSLCLVHFCKGLAQQVAGLRIRKKLTKQHIQNFESEKLAHKICAKNDQNFAKLAKMPKIAQKRPKTLNKTCEKNKN